MENARNEKDQEKNWNVLTSPWLEVASHDTKSMILSPIDALNQASEISRILSSSPLDLFAAYRFLLTLLYWKAPVSGGVEKVRESLINETLPDDFLDAIADEEKHFRLFDEENPFLQDTTTTEKDAKTNKAKKFDKSVGYLCVEFATGTNIAHFHHGDDKNMRLCLQCATVGLLRVVPWSQSGGKGITPAIHGAPPIMAIALGDNLSKTLGLNLVPLDIEPGSTFWTGYFEPSDKSKKIPYLEAFTWNPRRILLPLSREVGVCWACGKEEGTVVGQIIYAKNENTNRRKKGRGPQTVPFLWQDPAAFYVNADEFEPAKSTREKSALDNQDLKKLAEEEDKHCTIVTRNNQSHHGWKLIVPCTNPANNKTFDLRYIDIPGELQEGLTTLLPIEKPFQRNEGFDGWKDNLRQYLPERYKAFVKLANKYLTHSDWIILSAAMNKKMDDSPAAFDILSGLLWPLRKKDTGAPSRNSAWMMLKLMAGVPEYFRKYNTRATYNPVQLLPKRQINERKGGKSNRSPYPVSFPQGNTLENALRCELDKNMRKKRPEPINWANLCHDIDLMIE